MGKDEEKAQSLEDMKAAILEIDQKLSDHIKATAHLTDSGPEGQKPEVPSSDSGQAKLHELESENKTLKEKVAVLESDTYRRELIQRYCLGLNPESYIELGRKLGYVDELPSAEEEVDRVHEIALAEDGGQERVLFSKEVPADDPEGWSWSELLQSHIKVVA